MTPRREPATLFYKFNVLGVRLEPRLERALAQLARRRRTTKSALAREAIDRFVREAGLAEQAREQSLRASATDDLPDVGHDDRGWT